MGMLTFGSFQIFIIEEQAGGQNHAFNNEQARQQYLSALPSGLPACYEILACRPRISEGRTGREKRDLVWKYLDQNVTLVCSFNWGV